MAGPARTVAAVWLVGLLTYMVAVFHRSSLAVAGLDAPNPTQTASAGG